MIFKYGHGSLDLREQVLLIIGFLTKAQRGQLMLHYAMSKKAYDTQFHLFRKHISDYVMKVQEDMMGFYNLPKWSDVEADEAHG